MPDDFTCQWGAVLESKGQQPWDTEKTRTADCADQTVCKMKIRLA